MVVLVHFTLLFVWITQDFVSCVNTNIPTDFLTVALGDSLMLNCTYNCSTGFVRGCWSKAPDNAGCYGTIRGGYFCTISLHLPNVSTEDLIQNYTCYTQNTDDLQLTQKTERIVLLQLQVQTSAQNRTITPRTKAKNASVPVEPKESSEREFTGIKVLATVTVAVAMVLASLAVFLCLNWSRQNCKGEPVVATPGSPLTPHSAFPTVKGPVTTQGERVTLRIPAADDESDTEVPYADIMITVRGVSTPELTQVGYLSPGDQKEWWGDEPRCHLQASRSADRLHVPQAREVSRKMSTNSEYAVITYA